MTKSVRFCPCQLESSTYKVGSIITNYLRWHFQYFVTEWIKKIMFHSKENIWVCLNYLISACQEVVTNPWECCSWPETLHKPLWYGFLSMEGLREQWCLLSRNFVIRKLSRRSSENTLTLLKSSVNQQIRKKCNCYQSIFRLLL